jgi:purine-binding chemotaxis protein CheW
MSNQDLSGQYLTFKLAEELFAMDIAKVREILEFTTVTKLPCMPEYMRGVINLRGNVVPVVDLRLRLGLSATEKSVDTCVVITEVQVDGERTVLGALADSVQEVVELDAAHIAQPPRIGSRIKSDAIAAMGKREDQFVIILDIDRVFSDEEIRALSQHAGAAEAA